MTVEVKKFGAGEPEVLTEFAKRHQLTLEVRERGAIRYDLPRYSASFPNVEVMESGVLSGSYGNGNTPDEAASNYARLIARQRVVIGAYTSEREEIDVPNGFHHEA